jgi:hypothetical protein
MNYLIDINTGCGLYSRQAFIGPYGMGTAVNNYYISSASLNVIAHFKGSPKTFLIMGGTETS